MVKGRSHDMDYFRQCSSLETNPCVLFLTISLTLEEAKQLPNFGLDSLLSRFYGSVGTKKIYKWGIKTNIGCSFIRRMVETYCTLGKIQLSPTIHLGPTDLGE